MSVRAPLLLFMENPVCGPSTKADGTPESDIMTVKGLENGNKHIKQRPIKNGGEKNGAIFERSETGWLVLGIVDYKEDRSI